MFEGLTIVITDGSQVRAGERAGFRGTYLRDMELLNSFVMDMTSVCLRGAQKNWLQICHN